MSQNQFDAAAQVFRRILDERPDLLRVRLELARALYLAGKDEAARSQFETVLAADLPAPVAENVRTFLDRLRARRAQRLDVSLGYVADSDAIGRARQDTATINGLSYRLSDDAKRPSGSGVDIRARGRYRFPITERTQLTAWSDFSRADSINDRHDDQGRRRHGLVFAPQRIPNLPVLHPPRLRKRGLSETTRCSRRNAEKNRHAVADQRHFGMVASASLRDTGSQRSPLPGRRARSCHSVEGRKRVRGNVLPARTGRICIVRFTHLGRRRRRVPRFGIRP